MGRRAVAAIVVDGGPQFEATSKEPFVFGRQDADGIVGLDPTDMGISANAGSIEVDGGAWWVVNLSTKRDLLVEEAAGVAPIRVEPERRHAVSHSGFTVLVPGVIRTHRLQVAIPDHMLRKAPITRTASSGTIVAADLASKMLPKDRDVLTAMCAGYWRAFPHRDPRPRTYQEIADMLGGDWTQKRVEKQVERFKVKIAREPKLDDPYALPPLVFEGLRANYELCEYLVGNRVLTADDLERLSND